MKILLPWICFFLLCSAAVVVAQPRISNVRFQLDVKAKQIEITYDAFDLQESDSVYISVIGKRKGKIIPGQISGAIGKGVKAGKNRKVIWDVVADDLRIDDDLVVKVNVAVSYSPMLANADSLKKKPPVIVKKNTPSGTNGPALITLGAGLAAGGGLYYLSTIKKKESVESYETYRKRNWNQKSDLTFTGTDPDLQKIYAASLERTKADYKKAKRQQTLSKAMLFGGIAIVVADALFTVPMLMRPKNKRVSLLLDWDGQGVASAGIQLKF